ncbi:hypothetical protein VPH35_063299 [Triticum aestivum]
MVGSAQRWLFLQRAGWESWLSASPLHLPPDRGGFAWLPWTCAPFRIHGRRGAALDSAFPQRCALSVSFGALAPRRLRTTTTLLVPLLAVHPGASSSPMPFGSRVPFRLLGHASVPTVPVPMAQIFTPFQTLACPGLRTPSHPCRLIPHPCNLVLV